MLRVVVAVVLSVALLAASMPAVQTARVDYAHGRIDTELDGLVTTATRLQNRNDPPPSGVAGARRIVTLHLPGDSWTAAAISHLVIPGPTSEFPPGTVRYRLATGQERTRSTAAPLVGPQGGLRITGGNRHRLVLEYRQQKGRPVVVVRHMEFKSDAVTRPAYDTPGALGIVHRPGTG